jgi:hypothetical protein
LRQAGLPVSTLISAFQIHSFYRAGTVTVVLCKATVPAPIAPANMAPLIVGPVFAVTSPPAIIVPLKIVFVPIVAAAVGTQKTFFA